MTDILASTVFANARGGNAAYATARSTSNAQDTSTSYLYLGQYHPSDYFVNRFFIRFDTSGIAAGTLSSLKIRLTARIDSSTTDFDIQVVKYDWSAWAADLANATKRETAYDGCLAGAADDNIWRSTSGMSLDTPYESGELDPAWINRSGYTYYGFRSSRDFGNNTPTNDELIAIRMATDTTSAWRPYLVYTLIPSSIKKVAGVSLASIKKANSVAIGSIKKVAGVSNQ